MTKKDFTHLDKATGNPAMVDVGEKKVTRRFAKASCKMVLGKEIMLSLNDNSELITKKGPVFQTAIIAGTMGAKKTAELIPLCHPIGMDDCKVSMEAMTGASVAALTIYDMCKGFSHDILIKEIKLEEKTGGKSDFKR